MARIIVTSFRFKTVKTPHCLRTKKHWKGPLDPIDGCTADRPKYIKHHKTLNPEPPTKIHPTNKTIQTTENWWLLVVLFRPICCTYLSINIHKPLRASPVHVIEADGESSEFYRFLVHSGKALADRCWQGGPVFKKYSAGEPKASKYSYQDGKHVPTFQGNNYDKCIYIYTHVLQYT